MCSPLISPPISTGPKSSSSHSPLQLPSEEGGRGHSEASSPGTTAPAAAAELGAGSEAAVLELVSEVLGHADVLAVTATADGEVFAQAWGKKIKE